MKSILISILMVFGQAGIAGEPIVLRASPDNLVSMYLYTAMSNEFEDDMKKRFPEDRHGRIIKQSKGGIFMQDANSGSLILCQQSSKMHNLGVRCEFSQFVYPQSNDAESIPGILFKALSNSPAAVVVTENLVKIQDSNYSFFCTAEADPSSMTSVQKYSCELAPRSH